MRKLLQKIILTWIIVLLFAFPVFAVEPITDLPSSTRIEDLYGEASGLFNIEDYYVIGTIEEKMAKERGKEKLSTPSDAQTNASLILSTEELTLHPNYVEFVDAIWYEDGVYTNVSPIVNWESSDNTIVSSIQGNIWAGEPGDAIVNVTYRGITKTVSVHVVENPHSSFSGLRRAPAFITQERQKALNNALDMMNFQWAPTRTLKGWQHYNSNTGTLSPPNQYAAGTPLKGIIYTQSPRQKNLQGFKDSLEKSDFYTPTYAKIQNTNLTRSMPMYGNDCSGFVSFSWEISRHTSYSFIDEIGTTFHKIGTYNKDNPSPSDLQNAYTKLQPGDALVKKGHAMLVVSVDTNQKTVTVYEQTPDFPRQSVHSFASLSNAAKPENRYRPFTVYTSGQGHWQLENGNWYYYNASNQKLTGWQQIDNNWYYLGNDGAMRTGWQNIDNSYYYFHSNGIMVSGDWIQDKQDGSWYYLHGNGKMASHEWITKKGISYYFHTSGKMAANEWVHWTDGYWYYLTGDGSMAKNTSLNIKGVTYHFDAKGRCTNPNG